MIDPKYLFLIDSKEKVKLLLVNLKDKLIDIGMYELLVDWLWENFSNQKITLKKFNYNSKYFFDGSVEWQQWTNETTNLNSREASLSEELWTTFSLWMEQGLHTKNRFKYLPKNSKTAKGVMSGARFAIFDYINTDDINFPIGVQKQGVFIDTLQHERVHLFCRYYGVLKYDIPFASSLGLLTAQLHLSDFGYNYNNWTSAKRYFNNKNRNNGSYFHKKKTFLRSIRDLKRFYAKQYENDKSYIDGHNLAISSAEYFKSFSKARIFIELLTYGVKVEKAHQIAQSEIDYLSIYRNNPIKSLDVERNKPYFVYGAKINKKQRLGLWNPNIKKSILLCARHSLKITSFNLKSIFSKNNISNYTLAELTGLRGSDQYEAQHFLHKLYKYKLEYFSLPYSCYTSKPLVTETCLKVQNLLKHVDPYQNISTELELFFKGIGYKGIPTKQELNHLTNNHSEINQIWKTHNHYLKIWEKAKVQIIKLINDESVSDVKY